MTDKRIALTACGALASAEKMARALVERRLAACVNIVPGVKSFYRWKGAIESDEEVLLIIKTNERNLAALRDAVKELHSYDLPEFVVLKIDDGSSEYLSWIEENVRGG